MRLHSKHIKAQSLVTILVAIVIIGVGASVASSTLMTPRKVLIRSKEYVIALGYATELIEVLKAHTQNELKDYLSKNPFKPSNNPPGTCMGCSPTCTGGACATCAQCNPYPLCAHINLLDRTDANARVLNEDPIAALSAINPLDGPTPQTKANRYYQVQVINIKTMQRRVPPSECGQTATTVSLNTDERFMVTVGVSWFLKYKKNPDLNTDVERIVLTSVIP